MKQLSVRRATSTAALLASIVLLAGCFSLESDVTITADGTADIELTTLIDTEELGRLGELFGEDLGDLGGLGGLGGDELLSELSDGQNPCGDLTGSLAGYEGTTEEIDKGSEVGVTCTITDVPIADLNSIGEGTSLTIEQDEAGTRFTAELEGFEELSGGLGDVPGGTDAITELLDINLDELFSITFIVTAPGSLGDNNATSTDGATATWDLTADASFIVDGTASLSAEWTPGGGSGSSAWIVVALIAAVAVVAAIVVVIVTRKKRSQRAGAGAGAADGAGAAEGAEDPVGPPLSAPPMMAPPTSAPPTSAPVVEPADVEPAVVEPSDVEPAVVEPSVTDEPPTPPTFAPPPPA